MARIINSRCVLAVRDLQASTRCYKDVLGFNQDPIDAAGWGFLTRDSFRVMLGECSNEKPASELGDHSYFAYWNVDDVDQFYSEIVGRGALVMSNQRINRGGFANLVFAHRTDIELHVARSTLSSRAISTESTSAAPNHPRRIRTNTPTNSSTHTCSLRTRMRYMPSLSLMVSSSRGVLQTGQIVVFPWVLPYYGFP